MKYALTGEILQQSSHFKLQEYRSRLYCDFTIRMNTRLGFKRRAFNHTSAIGKLCMAFSALLLFLLQEEVETSVSSQLVEEYHRYFALHHLYCLEQVLV